MYITTIIKTTVDENVFAGFNQFSMPMLLEDLEKECALYNVSPEKWEKVLKLKKANRIMIETVWLHFNVFITTMKI